MQKNTPQAIDAWNSQAEAIDQTTLRLTEYQQKLRLQDPWEAAKQGFRDYADEAMRSGETVRSAMTDVMGSMENSLTEFVTTGKLQFSDLANSIIADLTRIAIRQSIVGPLAQALGGVLGGMMGGPAGAAVGSTVSSNFTYSAIFGNAKGGVYKSSSLSDHLNTVVDRPTLFPFARGIGLMGEAGAEAIMPLKRLGNGRLGVESTGSSGANVTVNIIGDTQKAGTVQQRQDGGVSVIDVFVERVKSAVASDIAQGTGAIPGALQSTYGLNRAFGSR